MAFNDTVSNDTVSNEIVYSQGPFSYVTPSSDQDIDDTTLGKLLTEAHREYADYLSLEGVFVSQSSLSVASDTKQASTPSAQRPPWHMSWNSAQCRAALCSQVSTRLDHQLYNNKAGHPPPCRCTVAVTSLSSSETSGHREIGFCVTTRKPTTLLMDCNGGISKVLITVCKRGVSTCMVTFLPLNDLLSERKTKNINGLQRNTLLDPVLGKHLGGIHQFLNNLRNWNFRNTLHNPLLNTVLGYGLRQFLPTTRSSPAQERKESAPLYPARFGLGLSTTCGTGTSTICSQILSEIRS